MLSFRIIIVAVCTFLAGFWGQNAFADSGQIKLELQDSVALGMGGAFTGEADRPAAVYYNPAGITQLNTIEASAGLTWVQPQMKFEPAAAGDASKMKEDNYLFPNVFITTPLIKDKLYLGIGESSDFGGGNDWEANGFASHNTTKDSIENQDYRLVVAYKINDQWSVGAGPVNDESKFEHDQALGQASGVNGDALFKASDDAWGFDLGTLFKLNAQNQFGLDYKSPIHHTYDGTFYMSGLDSSSTFGAGVGWATIFGNSFTTEAVQKLTLPQSVTLGYDFKPTKKLTFNFDLEWTDWAQYKQQTTFYPNVNSTQAGILATGNPQSRDWTAVWSESLGVQYALTDSFRLRTGYQHHQSPVPGVNFDAEFPDTDSDAVTFGVGYDLTKNLTIDAAYVAAFEQSRNVTTTIGSAALNGKYSGFANVGTMTLTYKF